MAKKLGRARTAAIILAIFFYVVAKAACYWTPTGWEHMMHVVLPVIFGIYNTAAYAFGDWARDQAFFAALLAVLVSMLGLAVLSSVTAYAIHILCKITERNGLSG